MNYKKIVLKVIRDNQICWVHFCYVAERVYDDFFRVTGCDKSEFGSYLSVWARQDFKVNLSMVTYEDICKLKKLVKQRYEYEYSELYSGAPEERISVSGWLKKWVTTKMKLEVILNE